MIKKYILLNMFLNVISCEVILLYILKFEGLRVTEALARLVFKLMFKLEFDFQNNSMSQYFSSKAKSSLKYHHLLKVFFKLSLEIP